MRSDTLFSWIDQASETDLAEAGDVLAQIWLERNFDELPAPEVEAALTLLVKNGGNATRTVLAHRFCGHHDIPSHIIAGLICGDAQSAAIMLSASLPLSTAELAALVPQMAAASCRLLVQQHRLESPVIHALATHADLDTCLHLMELHAQLLPHESLEKLIRRFGQVSEMRRRILALEELCASHRYMLALRLHESFLERCHNIDTASLAPMRAQALDMLEKTTVNILAVSSPGESRALLAMLVAQGHLIPRLLLRMAVMCDFSVTALALHLLSDMRLKDIHHRLVAGRRRVLHALFMRAQLPEPACRLLCAIVEKRRKLVPSGQRQAEPGAIRRLARSLLQIELLRTPGHAAVAERLLRALEAEAAASCARQIGVAARASE